MASIKISELNEYTEVKDDDLFPIVDVANRETKKVKATNIGTGGKELIMVGNESVATNNTKLLIEQDSLNSLGTEVVDSLDGNETTMAPSVRSVNKALENIKTTVESIRFADYLESNITSIVSRARKVNKRVVLEFNLSGNFAPNTNVKIATMPEGFRPNSHTYGTVTFHTGSVNMFVGSIVITSEGNVSVKSSGQASGVFATIVYDVD